MFTSTEAYERFMGRWSRKLAEKLVDFSEIAPGCRVLDLGCGLGSVSEAILDGVKDTSVVGIDPSTEYVGHARRRLAGRPAAFHEGDGQGIQQADESFDAALSMLVLNFVPEPLKAVQEMARVTRPGGIIAAAVWDYQGRMEMLRVFWDAAVSIDPGITNADERHQRLCSQHDLGKLFMQAGLENVQSSALEIEMVFESFEDYWLPFLGGQGPAGALVASLSAEKRNELQKALRLRLDTGDSFKMTARAWAAKAKRAEH